MGLFGNNYAKPGPGVRKDEADKRDFFVYFEVLANKFGKLMLANLLFCAFAIPILVLMFVFNSFVVGITRNWMIANFVTFLPFILLFYPLAGLTYLTQCFIRRKPVFVATDFFRVIKETWKVCTIHAIVSYFVGFSLVNSLTYYLGEAANNSFMLFFVVFCLVAIVLYFSAQYYIMQMIVCMDLPYINILKNGIFFVLAGIIRNILVTLVLGAVWYFVVTFFTFAEGVFFGVLILLCGFPAISSYTCNFVTYEYLYGYLIQPALKKKMEEDAVRLAEEEANQVKSEYIFENGRLIKRSEKEENIFKDTV